MSWVHSSPFIFYSSSEAPKLFLLAIFHMEQNLIVSIQLNKGVKRLYYWTLFVGVPGIISNAIFIPKRPKISKRKEKMKNKNWCVGQRQKTNTPI